MSHLRVAKGPDPGGGHAGTSIAIWGAHPAPVAFQDCPSLMDATDGTFTIHRPQSAAVHEIEAPICHAGAENAGPLRPHEIVTSSKPARRLDRFAAPYIGHFERMLRTWECGTDANWTRTP